MSNSHAHENGHSSAKLAAIVRSADPAMTIVTARTTDGRSGCLVGFHGQSSIDPERYTVWMSRANHTYPIALQASTLAVHFLASTDDDLARLFGEVSGDDTDKFASCAVREGPDGLPILARCPNYLVGRRIATHDTGGDHVGVSLEPIEIRTAAPFVPLRLHDVLGLDPGHSTATRHDAPHAP